ncbi:MAG: hypothetical protein KDB29_01680 [Planctomycetes bacterium]|nr:hypothetical protein [Planctomycetota bacterium]
MTLVVAQLVDGNIYFVADSRVTETQLDNRPEPFTHGLIKIQLFTRFCCIGISGNVNAADACIRRYTGEVLPQTTKRTKVTRLVECSADFEEATLKFFIEYFRGNSSSVSDPGFDLILGLVRPTPVLHSFKSGNHTQSDHCWIGDKAARDRYLEYYQERMPKEPSSYGSVMRTSTQNQHLSRHKAQLRSKEHESFQKMQTAVKRVIDDPSQPSVGGFRVAAYSSPDGFFYDDYADIMSADRDIDSSHAIHFSPSYNLPEACTLVLPGSSNNSDVTAVIFTPSIVPLGEPIQSLRDSSRGDVRPRSSCTGLVRRWKALKFVNTDRTAEDNLHQQSGIESCLSFGHFDKESSSWWFGEPPPIRLPKMAIEKANKFNAAISDVTVITPRLRADSRTALRAVRRAFHAEPRELSLLGVWGGLLCMRANIIGSVDARRCWTIASEILSQHQSLGADDPLAMAFLGWSLIECGMAKPAPRNADESCSRGVDYLFEASKSCLPPLPAFNRWVGTMVLLSPAIYGKARLKKHVAQALETLETDREKQENQHPGFLWNTLMLRFRWVSLSPEANTDVYWQETARIAAILVLQDDANPLANVCLGCAMGFQATRVPSSRRTLLAHSAVPYLSKAYEALDIEHVLNFRFVNIVYALWEDLKTSRSGPPLLKEADARLELMAGSQIQAGRVKALRSLRASHVKGGQAHRD